MFSDRNLLVTWPTSLNTQAPRTREASGPPVCSYIFIVRPFPLPSHLIILGALWFLTKWAGVYHNTGEVSSYSSPDIMIVRRKTSDSDFPAWAYDICEQITKSFYYKHSDGVACRHGMGCNHIWHWACPVPSRTVSCTPCWQQPMNENRS
jgi:hypothetical protein